MEKEASMLEDSKELFFKVIHGKFATSNDKDFENIGKILENEIKPHLSHAFVEKLLTDEEREVLSANLSWLLNKLLSIAVNDKEGM